MTYKELQQRILGFSSEQLDMEAIVYINDPPNCYYTLDVPEILDKDVPTVDGSFRAGQPILQLEFVHEGLDT